MSASFTTTQHPGKNKGRELLKCESRSLTQHIHSMEQANWGEELENELSDEFGIAPSPIAQFRGLA